MIGLLLIFLLCFLLGGVALGHWMIYGDPNSKIFTLGKIIVSLGKLRRKPRIQIEAVMGPPQRWVAIDNHAAKRVRSKKSV
jgi:hypothetical protein